jgi:ketosteroid isomerase-like protein
LSSERLEQAHRRIKAYNSGDFDSWLEGAAENVEWVIARQHPDSRTLLGVDEIRDYQADWQRTMPGLRLELLSEEETDDAMLSVCRLVGTGSGSGAETTAVVAFVTRFDGDEVIRVEEYLDPEEARRAL